jgi:hypothetical protein
METKENVKLTSGEMANLWASYLNDTMALCVNLRTVSPFSDKLMMFHTTAVDRNALVSGKK